MITLITGLPGSGKTAFCVDLLLSEYSDRPLYNDGLNGLLLDHFPIDVLDWSAQVEDGGVIVVDEVQRKWRPRGPGAAVPASVSALETHRHRGIDFILVTQNPRLLDSNVRSLVGRHLHIRDTGFLGRWIYEWSECSSDLGWKRCENKRRYVLPKRVFGLYKSASLHTKPVRRLPLLVYGAGLAVIVALVLGYRVFTGVKNEPEKSSSSFSQNQDLPEVSQSSQNLVSSAAPDERVDFIARISGRPWTAPAYDALRKVVSVPFIAGGICLGGDCRCYSRGGGRLWDVSSSDCGDWLSRAAFDPYYDPAYRSDNKLGSDVSSDVK